MPARKPPKAQEDSKSFKEEVIHQMHVISENVIDQVKLVAEGVSLLNDKVERYHEELKTEMADNYRTLGQAITGVDEKLIKTREELRIEIRETRQELKDDIQETRKEFGDKLDQTRQEFGAKLDQTRQEFSENLNKTRQELKTEIQDSRQEILAATKFSYAELDRRLTTLEKEFLDLRQRFQKIESRSAP